uniref:Palmitoyltransferase n=1 Tax=Panagrolaimus sp. JU765 TaxID=591449 RepID=A0AC34QKF9_9BILA
MDVFDAFLNGPDHVFNNPSSRKCRRLQVCLAYFACFLEFFVRKLLGKILLFAVYSLVLFVVFVAFAIVVPYESQHLPRLFVWILVISAIYLVINIFYHYYKACNTSSGRPLKSQQLPLCNRCHNHKPFNTHHCSMCGECVVNMDHHCVWINKCVGAGNHRHFFQFIGFLTLGCFIFCAAGYPTFYHNYWRPETKNMFCHLELDYFWISSLCLIGDDFISASVFFSYCLCAIIFVLVGGLFIWNILLISNNQTYVGMLKGDYSHLKRSTKEFITPWKRHDFKEAWLEFFGLKRGRTFFRHIMLPSAHKPLIPLRWDDETFDVKPLLEV